MIIKLPIKPISVNAAFQGRRFKTKICKKFDTTVQLMIRGSEGYIRMTRPIKGPYFVRYLFSLKNATRTDADNLIKVVQDNLVKTGIITDDRHIYSYLVEKVPADTDSIEIEILPLDESRNNK